MKANYRYCFQVLSLMVLVFSIAALSHAQSGRRGGKSTTTVPSVSGTKEAEAKPQKPARLQLLVGIDAAGGQSSLPYYLVDTVLDECVRRLGESSDVVVAPAAQHITRGEAVKAAKAEEIRYVVWLQLASDFVGASSRDRGAPNELWVSYTVLEPGTAKTKKSGRSYHSIYKVGNVGVSGPTRQSPVYSEYAIKQAAREAADNILEAFDIRIGGERWPR